MGKLIWFLGAVVQIVYAQNLLQLVLTHPELTRFASELASFPGLLITLDRDDANMTIFAPTNAAFEGSAPSLDEMTWVYHLIDGYVVTSNNLSDIQFFHSEASTYNSYLKKNVSQVLQISKNQSIQIVFGVPGDMKTTATVTSADNMASNGVLHLVDTILCPPAAYSTVAGNISSLFEGAVQASNLVNIIERAMLQSTVFAPIDRAFTQSGFTKLTGYGKSVTLQYHTVPQALYSNMQPGTYETWIGDKLTITQQNDQLYVNGVKILVANVLTATGVIHLIENVVTVPPNRGRPLSSNLALDFSMSTFSNLIEDRAYEPISDLLSIASMFTFFAPNNDAFAAMGALPDVATMTNLLHYLMVPQYFSATMMEGRNTLHSQMDNSSLVNLGGEGQVLLVQGTKGKIVVNDFATVAKTDILCSQGSVAHTVNKFLPLPADTLAVVSSSGLKTFLTALKYAKLDTVVSSVGSITLLTPTEDAFNKYLVTKNVTAITDLPLANITQLLFSHLCGRTHYVSTLVDGMQLTTLAGVSFPVSIKNGAIHINGNSSVVSADILTSNGVMYTIDTVLEAQV